MIPKIIHYCWLSNEEIPDNLQECIDSWHKHMPQYKIKRWTTQNFDINSVPLVKQAYAAKNGLLQQIIYGFMPYIRRVAYI